MFKKGKYQYTEVKLQAANSVREFVLAVMCLLGTFMVCCSVVFVQLQWFIVGASLLVVYKVWELVTDWDNRYDIFLPFLVFAPREPVNVKEPVLIFSQKLFG